MRNMQTAIKIGFDRDDRLDRAKRVEWLDVGRVSSSAAIVIGAGALGNEVAKNLALSGIRKLTIVDFDTVERSNLARCVFFTEMDALRRVGKAECLSRAVSSLAPGLEVVPIAGRVENLQTEALKEHDLIFGCLDNFNARIHVNAYSRATGKPYIDSGMQGTIGKIFVSNPPAGPCLECISNITHSRIAALRYSCTGSSVSFFMPPTPAEITTTSIIGALAAREGLRLLSPKAPPLEGQLIYYDGLRNSLELMEVDVDSKCPNHGQP
jgi:molybdopterin/thiamine biosynthesis adenylyltransferase